MVDYSKWDNIIDSDDDDEKGGGTEVKMKTKKMGDDELKGAQPSKPSAASGSIWNYNNWHWEEQKLDDWGKSRFSQIINEENRVERREFDFNGVPIDFLFTFKLNKVDGDVWTHIRKGRKIVGYNLDANMQVAGHVGTSNRMMDVFVAMEACVVVDDEISVKWDFRSNDPTQKNPEDSFPFAPHIKRSIMDALNDRVKEFLSELEKK